VTNDSDRLPPVVEGLANLSPLIRENADTVKFIDINPASRSAVSFNGTVRALPLDTDYVAIGWRQDVFFKHGINPVPPKTIEELADLSERLNGLDHNGDGEPDWGVCLTPQVNYFYAFVAPILQTQLRNSDAKTDQNMFFDVNTFEPLIRVPGFRYGLEQYWRIIRSSNCQGQLPKGEKCDRKTAFPTGRCAMVISMPGTLTSMLNGSRTPKDRVNESGTVVWSIEDQEIGPGGSYWGRRAPFPGSTTVQAWDREAGYPLVSCEEGHCPHADAEGVNYAPFFAEGGEAYALNGRQSKPAAQNVMWDVFTWLSELPVTHLPLSGQYRKSHLDEEAREQLISTGGWPEQMVDDLFDMLGEYFKGEDEGGNPVQDLLMLGFPEYMGALDEELHTNLLGVKPDSQGGFFDKADPSKSVDPEKDPEVFNAAFELFLDRLEERYDTISREMSGGTLAQLQRWRQSLNLPWRSDVELCSAVISIDANAFRQLACVHVVDLKTLCQAQLEDVSRFDADLCEQYYGNSKLNVIVLSVVIPVVILVLLAGFFYIWWQKKKEDTLWAVKKCDLVFKDPPHIIGKGTFGLVLLAEYRGTVVAVKRVLPPRSKDDTHGGSISGQSFDSDDGRSVEPEIELNNNRHATHDNGVDSTVRFFTKSRSHSGSNSRSSKASHSKRLANFIEEMRLLSKLRHPSIVTVMGAVVEKMEEPFLVMEYMELGSLSEVVQNKSIDLDGDLVLPILQEIAQGVRFLHGADPQIIHGDLKSNNILIDAKFSAKVADFGLSGKKRKKGITGTPPWMAPELLRGDSQNTTASDVYAFGIILYEVYARKEPYEGEDLATIIKGVVDPRINKRPPVPQACPPKIGELMRECLEPNPQARPSFDEIDLRLQRMSVESADPSEMHLSLHARKQKKASRANDLLLNVFPRHVAEALRDGRKVEPEHHKCVTIFFSDIVGFTTISSQISAEKVCDMLDRLYLKLDQLSEKNGVFKLETIGDAYMAITNIEADQAADHVKRIARFSLDAVDAAHETLIDLGDPSRGYVQIRVGFHTGPATTNVVGSRLPKYGVYGDTVNTASRMESNSLPGQVQCSAASAILLEEQDPELSVAKRGRILVKGKGKMTTYWVNKGGWIETNGTSEKSLVVPLRESVSSDRDYGPRPEGEECPSRRFA